MSGDNEISVSSKETYKKVPGSMALNAFSYVCIVIGMAEFVSTIFIGN